MIAAGAPRAGIPAGTIFPFTAPAPPVRKAAGVDDMEIDFGQDPERSAPPVVSGLARARQGLSPPLLGYTGSGNGVTLLPSPASRILFAPSRRTSSMRITAWNGT